jgi:hypothetical protein
MAETRGGKRGEMPKREGENEKVRTFVKMV